MPGVCLAESSSSLTEEKGVLKARDLIDASHGLVPVQVLRSAGSVREGSVLAEFVPVVNEGMVASLSSTTVDSGSHLI